jgi:hypothetical protein
MDILTLIVALVVGLYDMVPWREVLIGVGIIVWLWAGLQKSYVLGRSLDELKADLHRLEDKLDVLGASKAQQDYPNGSAMTGNLDHVEEKIERAGSETLNRMVLLAQKGYKTSTHFSSWVSHDSRSG